MPIVNNSDKIKIEFSAEAAELEAKIKDLNKDFDGFAKQMQTNRNEAQKLAEKYNGSLVPGLQKAGEAVKNFVSKNSVLIGAVTAVGAAVYKSFQAFQDYAGEVRDLSLITGTGAEATSLFIQVLDDYQLTAKDAETATKALKEKGLVPTIDTLADLATKYQAIQDPADKMAFIQDNLGKGGVKWVNVLNQSADALRRSSEEVSKSLILTDEQVRKSEQARLAIDAWSDAIEGAKVSIGSLIGVMIANNSMHSRVIEILKQEGVAVGRGVENTQAYKDALQKLENAELGAARSAELHGSKLDGDLVPSIRSAKEATDQLAESQKAAEEAAKALADSSNQYMSTLSSVASETESYNEKNTELVDKLKELTDEQANTATWTGKYQDLTTEITETKSAISKLAAEHKKASDKIIFDLMVQSAAANGFKDISVEALSVVGEQMGVLPEGSAAATTTMIAQAKQYSDALKGGPYETLDQILGKIKNIQKIAEIPIDVSVNVWYSSNGGTGNGVPGGGQGMSGACFTGETLITMADGSFKPIDQVQAGDKLLSYDLESSVPVPAKVESTIYHAPHEGGRLLRFNGFLRVTEEHYLYNGHRWIPAALLRVGDSLMRPDGSGLVIHSIEEIKKTEPTYNLHMDHVTHNYFAGGILAHNPESKWTGGQLNGNWTLVGDMPGGIPTPYSELISPSGHVFDAKTSQKLLQAGVLGGVQSMYEAGDVYTSGGGGGTTGGSTGGVKPKPTGGKAGGGGGGLGTVSFVSASSSGGGSSAESTASQDATNAVTVAIQQQIAQQQQVIESNAQIVAAVQELGGIMKRDNPKAVGRELAVWMG